VLFYVIDEDQADAENDERSDHDGKTGNEPA